MIPAWAEPEVFPNELHRPLISSKWGVISAQFKKPDGDSTIIVSRTTRKTGLIQWQNTQHLRFFNLGFLENESSEFLVPLEVSTVPDVERVKTKHYLIWRAKSEICNLFTLLDSIYLEN